MGAKARSRCRAIFYFRDGGIIISSVDESDDAASIAQRMTSEGYIIAGDDFWTGGKARMIAINLSDVSYVILTPITQDE